MLCQLSSLQVHGACLMTCATPHQRGTSSSKSADFQFFTYAEAVFQVCELRAWLLWSFHYKKYSIHYPSVYRACVSKPLLCASSASESGLKNIKKHQLVKEYNGGLEGLQSGGIVRSLLLTTSCCTR